MPSNCLFTCIDNCYLYIDPGTGAKSAVLSNVGVPAGTGLVGVAPGLAYSSTPVPG